MEGISHEAISLAGHLQARSADRAVRRQRASRSTARPRCRARTTSSRASRRPAGRPRRIDGHDPDGDRGRDREGPAERPAVADRLPHGDRLWLARTARALKRRMARRSARTRSQRPAPHWTGRTRRSRFRSTCSARWREVGGRGSGARATPGSSGRGASTPADALAVSRCPQPANCRASYADAHGARCWRGFAAERPTIATRQASQLVIDGIAEGAAEPARRLGRPDPLQSDPRQDARRRSRRRRSTAATSITASANTPWRRR